QRVVFEHEHGGRDRVERAAARREDVAPGDQRCSQPGVVERAARLVHQTAAQSACAAMDGEREAGAGIAGRAGHYASADFLCRLSSRAMDPGATSLNGAVVPMRSRFRGGLRLVMLGLGVSVVPLDTAVNISFPDITGSFGLPLAMIQWVIICYVLTHAGLMLAFGRAGDIWSHGSVLRAGLAWSTVAFILCALAPTFGWLLFFRFLQGIGAGLIISCAPAVVTSLYPETRRAHALGIFTLMFALGSAVGPLIGGALVARWGWPGVFWFRAPIALTALVLLHGLPAASGGRGERSAARGRVVGARFCRNGGGLARRRLARRPHRGRAHRAARRIGDRPRPVPDRRMATRHSAAIHALRARAARARHGAISGGLYGNRHGRLAAGVSRRRRQPVDVDPHDRRRDRCRRADAGLPGSARRGIGARRGRGTGVPVGVPQFVPRRRDRSGTYGHDGRLGGT